MFRYKWLLYNCRSTDSKWSLVF